MPMATGMSEMLTMVASQPMSAMRLDRHERERHAGAVRPTAARSHLSCSRIDAVAAPVAQHDRGDGQGQDDRDQQQVGGCTGRP